MVKAFFKVYCWLALWWISSPKRQSLGARPWFPVVLLLLTIGIGVGSMWAVGNLVSEFLEQLGFWRSIFVAHLGFGLAVIASAIVGWVLLRISRAELVVATAVAGSEDPLREAFLVRNGFIIDRRGADRLVATRISHEPVLTGGVEVEWRDLPLQIEVRSVAEGHIEVRAITIYRVNRMREFIESTASMVANADDAGMDRLGQQVPQTQAGLFMGHLGNKIFLAIAGSVLVCMTAIVTPFVVGATDLAREADEGALANQLVLWHLAFKERLTGPERQQAARMFSSLDVANPDWASFAKGGAEPGGSNLVIALVDADGKSDVVLPSPEHPLRRSIEESLRFESMKSHAVGAIRDLGGVALIPLTDARFKPKRHEGKRLFVGAALTHAELAMRGGGGFAGFVDDLTYFDAGLAQLHFKLGGASAQVDGGQGLTVGIEHPLKQRQLTRTTLVKDSPERLMFRKGTWQASGFSGYIAMVPDDLTPVGLTNDQEFALFERFWPLYVGLLLGSYVIAVFLSWRLSKPLVQVKNSLRAIADGDYAARIGSKRKDEIGQLQRLVDRTAEQLQRREAIRELMGMYLSKQVADQIMKSNSTIALGGARTEVSVLFADVRGFTTYSEANSPEKVTKTLNEYFEVMVDVVASHDGVLDKFIGDGIMVVFGAPIAQADHALRAVVTALEMQAQLATLNLKRAQRGDEPIAIGIGVNSGVAIAGNLGSLKRMEFTVVGDTVNTAARLEGRAAKGEVLIGQNTYLKVAHAVRAEPLGAISVKGKAAGVEVWRVTGLTHEIAVGKAAVVSA